MLPYAFVWEKTFKNFILQNWGCLMAESLHILLGTSACLQWLCHSGERTMARGPLVIYILQIRKLFLLLVVFWTRTRHIYASLMNELILFLTTQWCWGVVKEYLVIILGKYSPVIHKKHTLWVLTRNAVLKCF